MTFTHQNLDLTLPDSSLNMELYHKDHLYLIKNGNIKYLKLIIETLQEIIITVIITVIITMLVTSIFDHIATSIFITQVKSSFS